MSATGLIEALPPTAQIIAYGLGAVVAAVGIASTYLKTLNLIGKKEEEEGPPGTVILASNDAVQRLTNSIERLDATLQRQSTDADRIVDATRNATDATKAVVRALTLNASLTPVKTRDEEILDLLRQLMRERGVDRTSPE